MPCGHHVDRASTGSSRLGKHLVPDGGPRRALDSRRNQCDGRLSGANSRASEIKGRPRTAMKELVAQLLSNGISRRDFVRRLVASGVTVTAAKSILESVDTFAQTPGAPAPAEAVDRKSTRL